MLKYYVYNVNYGSIIIYIIWIVPLLWTLLQVFAKCIPETTQLMKDTTAQICSEFRVFWWKAVTLIHLMWCSALPDYSEDVHTAVFLLLFPSQEVHHVLSLTPKCPAPSTAPQSLKSLPFELSVKGCIRVTISRIRTELPCDWLP